MATKSAPTLSDVAKAAGVSTATVSRCLNSPDQVVDATREKVMKTVRQLGYSPNFGARVMAAKRTNTIGAIIPTMENAIFARGLQAFQEGLGQKGYTLLVASSSYKPDLEEEQIRSLVARGADGLLLIGHDRAPSVNEFLKSRGIPTLVAWSHDPQAIFPDIGFDNRAAMRTLTERVIAFGHRHVGVISAHTQFNDRARHRVEGVRDALKVAGIDPADMPLIETSYGIDAGAEAFAKLMSNRPVPTAVICGNDVLAVGAVTQARAMGLDVPGDVSITGFDDIELARISVPPIATIHVPHRDMGSMAARMLIDMVEGKSKGQPVRLEATLRLRASLGPPPATT